MAMRSALNRGSLSLTRPMDSNRGAFTRFFSDKGRVLSDEEQAKENVYIQILIYYGQVAKIHFHSVRYDHQKKWERERLEKLKQKNEKEKAEKEKGDADKKPERTHQG